MARKQDNYENDFLGCLRWNNEWFHFPCCSCCSGTLALDRTSPIASQEERGHFPTIHGLMKTIRVGLQDGAFKSCLNEAKACLPYLQLLFLRGEPRLAGF